MSEPQVAPFHATPFEQVDMSVTGAGVIVCDGDCDEVLDVVGAAVEDGVEVDDGEAPGDRVEVCVKSSDCEGDGVCVFDADIGDPRTIILSTERAADAEEPTATATIRQHTVGLLFAADGIAGDRMEVTHAPAGEIGVVTPKAVNAPAVPVVL